MSAMWGKNSFLRNTLEGNDKKQCHSDLLEEVTEAGDDFRIFGTIADMQNLVSGKKQSFVFCHLILCLTMKNAPGYVWTFTQGNSSTL